MDYQQHPLKTHEGLPLTKCSPAQIKLHEQIRALSDDDPDAASYVLTSVLSDLILDSVPCIEGAKRSKARPTKSWLLTGRSSPSDFRQLGFDHEIALILPDGSRAILGQPYNIEDRQLNEIEKLRAEGFQITVSSLSPHYPLWTISVIIQPPASNGLLKNKV